MLELADEGQHVVHVGGITWVQRIDVGPWISQKCARDT